MEDNSIYDRFEKWSNKVNLEKKLKVTAEILTIGLMVTKGIMALKSRGKISKK